MWPVWAVAPVVLLVGWLVARLVYLQLAKAATPVQAPGGSPRVDTLEVIKTTLTVLAFAGALLTGLYAYRKQRLAEGDASRADAQQFADRYSKSAEQLGSEQAAVRLAGVYAMARLADDWRTQRQTCIDVLCAYLRMPYQPREAEGHRPGEDQVRKTILKVIIEHLQDDVATGWGRADFDLTGAILEDASLSGAVFGGRAVFSKVQFQGPTHILDTTFLTDAVFDEAEFTDDVSFGGSRFLCGSSFKSSHFKSVAMFGEAEFVGESWFSAATFGQESWFSNSSFRSGASFYQTRFCGESHFDGAIFSGRAWFGQGLFVGDCSFHDATFAGVALFTSAELSGRPWFGQATFRASASFANASISPEGVDALTEATFLAGVERGPFIAPQP